MKAGFHLELV